VPADGAGAGTGTKPAAPAPPEQLSFFDFAPNPVLERLKALDLMEIKPSEAFSRLEALQEAALKDGP
jgi:DNA mismatch repair protein MutS